MPLPHQFLLHTILKVLNMDKLRTILGNTVIDCLRHVLSWTGIQVQGKESLAHSDLHLIGIPPNRLSITSDDIGSPQLGSILDTASGSITLRTDDQ